MKKVKLTKIEELSNAEVPNNIPINAERIGMMKDPPEVGRCFYIHSSISSYFRTSTVTEIIDETTFKTRNSIYKIEEK